MNKICVAFLKYLIIISDLNNYHILSFLQIFFKFQIKSLFFQIAENNTQIVEAFIIFHKENESILTLLEQCRKFDYNLLYLSFSLNWLYNLNFLHTVSQFLLMHSWTDSSTQPHKAELVCDWNKWERKYMTHEHSTKLTQWMCFSARFRLTTDLIHQLAHFL